MTVHIDPGFLTVAAFTLAAVIVWGVDRIKKGRP